MRVVSLSPSLTEILQALNAQETLIGVTDHCPAASSLLAKIGSPKALSLDRIRGLKPDFILADEIENRPEEIRELKKDFKVVSFEVRSLQAAGDAIGSLGRLLGKTAEAKKLQAEILSEEKKNKTAAGPSAPVPSLILLWAKPYITVNFDTYPSRLIEASGARNVFHEDPLREFPVDLEDMIEKNPMVLVLPTEPFAFQARHVSEFRKYRLFSKIRIELVDGRFFSRYGPRTPESLRFFRRLLLS